MDEGISEDEVDEEEHSRQQGEPFERFFEDNFEEDDVQQDTVKTAKQKNLDKLF